MLGRLLTSIFWFILTLPIKILLAFRFSAIFTFAGFTIGLLCGILGGYFFFIYPEKPDLEEIQITEIAERELSPEEKKRFYKLLPPWVHTPDIERVAWFNRMMGLMWPYIDKAVAEQVLEQATPIIESSKPSFVDSIEFESLTLGTLSPGFIGIKSFQTMEDEVIIQPEIRWIGRPNIKVVVKVFGMKLSAHLTHFSMQAPLRITLKPLSNYFPCFSRIVISLMSLPTIDVGLSILGLDFLAIPFVNKLVDAQVEAALSDMLLWPNTMKVYDDEAKPTVGKIIVREIRAMHLKNIVGLVGTIDPFVVLGFGKKVGNFQTAVQMDTTEPEWTEEGALTVREGAEELLVQVFHRKKPFDVLIGAAWVQLFDVLNEPGAKKQFTVTLKEKVDMPGDPAAQPTVEAPANVPSTASLSSKRAKGPRETGTINFTLEYKQRKVKEGEDGDEEEEEEEIIFDKNTKVGGGKLWLKLRSGSQLEAKKSDFNHPTVFLKFRGDEKKTEKYKEPDIDIFNEIAFTWDCPDYKPENDTIHVKVVADAKGPSLSTVTNPMALKRLLHSQDVGTVDIPLRDVVANGRVLDDFSLVGSKGASLKIEIRWKEKTKADE